MFRISRPTGRDGIGLRGTAALAALVVAACSPKQAPPRAERVTWGVPGTLWSTPVQRWRVPRPPHFAVASGGATLIVDRDGWIGLVDLTTGQLVRESRLDGVQVWDVLALPDGQWLVVGIQAERAIAATIDHADLTAKTVALGQAKPVPAGTYADTSAGAAVVDDGVALAGPGLALAIYDPATWTVRRVVDPVPRWRRLRGSGAGLYATGLDGAVRFDLATGRSEAKTWQDLRVAGYTARAATEGGQSGTLIERDGQRIALVEGTPMAVDAADGLLATSVGHRLVLHGLADGKRLSFWDLGEIGYTDWNVVGFVGPRLVVSAASVIKVIDRATSGESPVGEPPYGRARELRVADDGAVLHVGYQTSRAIDGKVAGSTHVVRLEDGKPAVATRISDELAVPNPLAIAGPGEVSRYARLRLRADGTRVELHVLGKGPRASWSIEGEPHGGWLGSGDTLVVATAKWNPVTLVPGPLSLWMLRGSTSSTAGVSPRGPAIRAGAAIQDLDVDAGVAVIQVSQAMHLVRIGDGSSAAVLRPPDCSNRALLHRAGIERGGDRVYVQSGRSIAVFRRSTGALIGAAQLAAGGTIAFVPHHDELLAGGDGEMLALWNAATGAQRVLPGVAGLDSVAVSPDGLRAALAWSDGRVAVVNLDTLRADMEPRAAPSVALPDHCETASPLATEARP